MTTFRIRSPIWKDRSVGLDRDKLEIENVVYIDYKNKQGEFVFPFRYKIDGAKARTYPTRNIGRGVNLAIIPIADLEKDGER